MDTSLLHCGECEGTGQIRGFGPCQYCRSAGVVVAPTPHKTEGFKPTHKIVASHASFRTPATTLVVREEARGRVFYTDASGQRYEHLHTGQVVTMDRNGVADLPVRGMFTTVEILNQ